MQIYADEVALNQDDSTDTTSDLVLAGPSRLPRLSSLEINFNLINIGNAIFHKEDVQPVLKKIYQHSFDRALAEQNCFSSLRVFHTHLKITTSTGAEIDERETIRNLKEELPSVFGPGGRREMRGLQTAVSVKIMEDRGVDLSKERDHWLSSEEDDTEGDGDRDEDKDDASDDDGSEGSDSIDATP